jgi:hypothetical protein
MRRVIIALSTAAAALTIASAVALAANGTGVPPNWHVHDGQTSLGPEHKGIGFFPTVLGVTTAEYLQDPAECPNATDKAFLPSWDTTEAPHLRAGICVTSARTIHLRTLPVGTAGPAGWSSLTTASEPGWVTYYAVTAR